MRESGEAFDGAGLGPDAPTTGAANTTLTVSEGRPTLVNLVNQRSGLLAAAECLDAVAGCSLRW